MDRDHARPGDLGRLIRDAQRAIEVDLISQLRHAGYPELRPGHMLVFRHLDRDGMRATDLARDARVTRQAMSQVVAELEGLGILEQVPDPSDGRAKVIRYTARGERGYAVAESVFAAMERRHADAVGDRALSATRRVLAAIAQTSEGADDK
jgi:DNA-binding MarR family transcriptional regulator